MKLTIVIKNGVKSGQSGQSGQKGYFMRKIEQDSILDEYLSMLPSMGKRIINWDHVDPYKIIIELDDGCFDKYDSITKTIRHYRSYADLTTAPKNEDEWRERFSTNLYRKMILEGYSQEELSYYTKISTGTISNYINGVTTPTLYKISQIARVLGCSIDELDGFN